MNTPRIHGWRAVIEFTPKPTSNERLCAGVVLQAENGEIVHYCAIDLRKMEHAFGAAGIALHDVALKLCESLTHHWKTTGHAETWRPPFDSAKLSSLDRFSALDTLEAAERIMNRSSTLHTLLSAYEVPQQSRNAGIVEKVRAAVKRDVNAKHLVHRFNRELMLNGEAQPFKVDFLGQHYACYFLQVTQHARGLENSIERAYGKLFELQALKRMVKKPKKSLGLLEEERPEAFELLMVGNRSDPVQRRAIYQVEALADKGQVTARIEPSASAAAERVADQERLAA